jgi:hypothetical protein
VLSIATAAMPVLTGDKALSAGPSLNYTDRDEFFDYVDFEPRRQLFEDEWSKATRLNHQNPSW